MAHHKDPPAETRYKLDEQAGMPRVDCPYPHKVAYASRKAARRVRKRFDKAQGKLSAYLCSCGNWHLGRLPVKVRRGIHERLPPR